MTTDNKDQPDQTEKNNPSPFNSDYPQSTERREPSFGGFDERSLEEYEEPDRDTTLASGFSADDIAEEEELDLFTDEDDDEFVEPEANATPATFATTAIAHEEQSEEEPEEWIDDDEYFEDEESGETGWPLRIIVVAAIAVVLVTAGVYGVLQERAATEAELRDLRATLATSANQEDVRSSRDRLQVLQQSHDALRVETEALSEENRQLRETIAALEKEAAPATPPKEAAPAPASKKPEASAARPEPTPAVPPTPQPASKPVASQPAAAPSGRWFVNFGSYSSRALAESWSTRLRPVRGEVIVAPSTKDGKTYYRVRVIGLDGKSSADLVARQLEAEQQVPKLWVGQD